MTRWSSALECRILSCSLLCGGVSRSWGTAAEVGGMREEQEMAAGAVMLYHTAAPRGLELKNTNQEAFVSVQQQDSCIYSRFFLKARTREIFTQKYFASEVGTHVDLLILYRNLERK